MHNNFRLQIQVVWSETSCWACRSVGLSVCHSFFEGLTIEALAKSLPYSFVFFVNIIPTLALALEKKLWAKWFRSNRQMRQEKEESNDTHNLIWSCGRFVPQKSLNWSLFIFKATKQRKLWSTNIFIYIYFKYKTLGKL